MDLIARGSIAENFIKPSFGLVETFNDYWNSIMPLAPIEQLSIVDFKLTEEVNLFEKCDYFVATFETSKTRYKAIV